MAIQIDLHWNFSNMTIRSTKTGNRIENRTPDRPENFMNESVCHYKFICIKIFMIGPLEVQKPETGQKTGSRSGKFFSMKVAEVKGKFDGTIKFTIFLAIQEILKHMQKVTTKPLLRPLQIK